MLLTSASISRSFPLNSLSRRLWPISWAFRPALSPEEVAKVTNLWMRVWHLCKMLCLFIFKFDLEQIWSNPLDEFTVCSIYFLLLWIYSGETCSVFIFLHVTWISLGGDVQTSNFVWLLINDGLAMFSKNHDF